jgi:organic hydroperoxide reductase OsmC/OhrA
MKYAWPADRTVMPRPRRTGIPDLRCAAPADFDGSGDAWSPEHLLLAAVQTCFLFTLRSVAKLSKFQFKWLQLSAHGVLDRKKGVTRFTEIVLRPRLSVAHGTDRAQTPRIMEKSEKARLISASLSTPVRLEPEVIEG